MADIPFPRGVRDLMPNEALFRNEVLKKIESVYQMYGFLSIDTPTFESTKVLKSNNTIGEEAKLIYEMKDDDVALRYDFTVSLARYMAMHQELPLPFKRYCIGKSWRRDEPQYLRYREFTQADVDIVGGRPAAADAEILGTSAVALDAIGMNCIYKISSRKILNEFLASRKIKQEQYVPIMRIIDKFDKIGRDGVVSQLGDLGLDRDNISAIDELINLKGTNEEKLDYVGKMISDKSSIAEITETLELLKLYNFKGAMEIDFSIVRGIAYYTGVVFEIKASGGEIKSSVGGGGRYDNMVGVFSGKQVPAVGISLGIDRILDIMGISSSLKSSYADVFIITVNDSNYKYALKMANLFRREGIATEINLATRNISNQLSYANSMKFRYAMIIGNEEEKTGKVKLRDLLSGEETLLLVDEAIDAIKGQSKQ
ncbi:MAG: histidine--tRNA ligase [Candidatus Marsarchaeota archaeon]|nr:histidine--tRNA ligase [Candidatus Marsarchaeota archaeon]